MDRGNAQRKRGGSVKWNVGPARESILSLAPKEGPGPSKNALYGGSCSQPSSPVPFPDIQKDPSQPILQTARQ